MYWTSQATASKCLYFTGTIWENEKKYISPWQLNFTSSRLNPRTWAFTKFPTSTGKRKSATWCKPISEGQPARGSFHRRVWVEFDVSNLTLEAKVVSTISTHDLQVAVEKSYLCTNTHPQTIVWRRQNKKHRPCMDKRKRRKNEKEGRGRSKRWRPYFGRLQLILPWRGST